MLWQLNNLSTKIKINGKEKKELPCTFFVHRVAVRRFD